MFLNCAGHKSAQARPQYFINVLVYTAQHSSAVVTLTQLLCRTMAGTIIVIDQIMTYVKVDTVQTALGVECCYHSLVCTSTNNVLRLSYKCPFRLQKSSRQQVMEVRYAFFSHSSCMCCCLVQVDFWSFGVIAFELLTLKRPFLHNAPGMFEWSVIEKEGLVDTQVHIHMTCTVTFPRL